ncbi:MAG: hypothetical protein A2W95_05490 [Bacteroidetes bacterium GWA2_40_14]|nr:MAG: hypothetical protein A2W95_05490 [Bacteroidetes bacterium GWA2_40_14]HAZ02203.1 chemotaxis protein CheR [Marinilabiliales bacterium]
MRVTLSEDIMSRLSRFIASNFALHFPKERWGNLERNMVTTAKEFGYSDTEKFIQHVISASLTREDVGILAANLTTTETYFWRELQTFEALEQIIIPEMVRCCQKGEKRIRVWSAGCSTGEEPYSIAIALKRKIHDIKDWDISILATDINPRALQKAETGEYGQWSFRGTPRWLKERYFFQKPNNRFEIIPEIKCMVNFEYLNLAEDVYPSSLNNTNGMDIIFCRNVLMYFTQEHFRLVEQRLYDSLKQSGYLIVSASELSMQNFPEFTPINIPGTVFYQKNPERIKSLPIPATEKIPYEQVLFQKQPTPDCANKKLNFHFHETEKEIFKKEDAATPINSIYKESLTPFSQNNFSEVIDKPQEDEQTLEEQLALIRAYTNQGKLIEAINTCEKVIETNKTDPRSHYLYATILQENNRLDDAIASLKRAIYLNPDFVLAYYLLGNICKQQGNVITAKKYFEITSSILNKCNQDDILFESEGLTIGRFREIISTILQTSSI